MREFKTLKKMLHQVFIILNNKQRRRVVVLFVVILIGSLFELISVTSIMPLIQAILNPEEIMAKNYIRPFIDLFNIVEPESVLILVGIGIVIIYLVKNSYLSLSAYFQAKYSNDIQRELSVTVLRAYLHHPYSFFVDNTSGDIIRGINTDTTGVYNVIQNGFKLLSELLVIILLAVYLISTDYVLALGVLIAGFTCMFVIVLGVKKILSKLSNLYRNSLSIKNQWVIQAIEGIKDIMVYDRRSYFVNGFDDAYADTNKANTNYTFVGALPERVIEAFCISGIIITVLIRTGMGIEADEFVPKLSVFAMAAFRILPSISRSIGYINAFVYYKPSVEATYENIVEAKKYQDINQSMICESDNTTKNTFENYISINSIDWRYPQGKDYVLSDLSLIINKGESIGIIGGSGSGKSTLADILLRLYQPQKGYIYMDGIDINTIPDQWTNVISYVPQFVFLLDDTIRENVAFGRKNVSDEIVWKSLKQASLDEFVRNLPEGLDTIVGERGVKFSGGQRQRIAIARALYSNPQIVILDEATSALDNETEEAVMEAIDSLAGSMTLIIIAHRVTTLKGCDKIYEIVDGKAVERSKEEVIHV